MNLALLLTLALLSLLLLTHDLIPLGRWNNLRASAPTRPLGTRIVSTLLNSLVGLIPAWLAFRSLHTIGLTNARQTILIFLAILLLGELSSWWIPWAFGASAFGARLSFERRRHLAAMTTGTLTVVPERHGIQPNALHCAIHLLTLLAFVETLLTLRH